MDLDPTSTTTAPRWPVRAALPSPLPQVLLDPDPLLEGRLARLADRQLGLLTTAQLAAHGVTRAAIRHRVDTRRWRHPTRGVLDVGRLAPSDLGPAQRAARSAVLGLLTFGPASTAVGTSALVLHGVWGVPLGAAPEITMPEVSERRDRDGIRCRRFRLQDPVVVAHGYPVASVVEALTQALPETDPRTALGLVDSALHRGLLTEDGLAEVRRRTLGRRGSRALQVVWPLVDPRRESPIESWACFDLHTAGLPPTDVQVEIRDEDDRVLARADIGFRLEDGSWHFLELDGRAFHPDAVVDDERDNALVGAVLSQGVRATVARYRSNHLGPGGRMVHEVREVVAGTARQSRAVG